MRIALPSIVRKCPVTVRAQGGGNILIAAGTSAATSCPHLPIYGGYSSDAWHILIRCSGYATVGQTDLTHPLFQWNGQANDYANDAGWADLKIYYAAGVDAGPGARDRPADRRHAPAGGEANW